MSGIDLWDDDFSDIQADSQPQSICIALIAAAEHEAFWRLSLEQHGITFVGVDSPDCRLMLIDNRTADYPEQLNVLDKADLPRVFLLGTAQDTWPDDAADCIHLPINAEALAKRLQGLEARQRELLELREQLALSTQVSFQSMSLNAELGRILQFMESSCTCSSFAELAEQALRALNELGLHASLGIFHNGRAQFYFDDHTPRPIEQELLESSRQLGRISDFGPRTILNYTHVNLLLRNMPLDDPLRYGILKDHICYIGNGVEARVLAIINEMRAEERLLRIQTTAGVLQQMIGEMESGQRERTRQITDELQQMLDTLQMEFANLVLTGTEEERLMQMLTSASDRIHQLFKNAAEQDKLFQALLARVTSTLER